MNWLRKLFGLKEKPRYVYGRILRLEDGHAVDNVRLDTKTGRVQFVLWPAGHQQHAVDYWHDTGAGWELHFISHGR